MPNDLCRKPSEKNFKKTVSRLQLGKLGYTSRDTLRDLLRSNGKLVSPRTRPEREAVESLERAPTGTVLSDSL